MIEHKNIHEAINAVMQEVGYVQKQKSDGLKYTYAGEASLIEAVRPSMVAHGIYMHVKRVVKIFREQYSTKSGTQMSNTMIQGVVRFAHVSGTHIDVEATGEGADSGDKSSNKAMTGLYKYALRQTFCIETGDDPDRFPSEDFERTSSVIKANGNKPESKPAAKPDVVKDTQELADGYTGNQILGSKDGSLVKELVGLTGNTTVDVCKFVGKLEKGKKFTLGQVVNMMTMTQPVVEGEST